MITRKCRKLNRVLQGNKGTTLVEMLVCFALLAIFLVSATMFISNITELYYRMKGETYSRQVSDIILEKISSEIDGAEYGDSGISNPRYASDYSYMDLYDKTDTHVKVMFDSSEKIVKIYYYPITGEVPSKDRAETTWTFDESVYYGFTVEDMRIVSANSLAAADLNTDVDIDISDYGLTAVSGGTPAYPNNVAVVLLHINHPQYGESYTYRFVRMHNVPEDASLDVETVSTP